MPDYEGLLRAVQEGLGVQDVRQASEAYVASMIASMIASMTTSAGNPPRPSPLTGEMVRDVVCGEWRKQPTGLFHLPPTTKEALIRWDRIAECLRATR